MGTEKPHLTRIWNEDRSWAGWVVLYRNDCPGWGVTFAQACRIARELRPA